MEATMAHYKRGRPRTSPSHNTRWNKWRSENVPEYRWMSHWPRYWDIVFHTRPHRRRTRECVVLVMQGRDPDNIAWPVAKKPHIYYW
jgi:hypothetical protein